MSDKEWNKNTKITPTSSDSVMNRNNKEVIKDIKEKTPISQDYKQLRSKYEERMKKENWIQILGIFVMSYIVVSIISNIVPILSFSFHSPSINKWILSIYVQLGLLILVFVQIILINNSIRYSKDKNNRMTISMMNLIKNTNKLTIYSYITIFLNVIFVFVVIFLQMNIPLAQPSIPRASINFSYSLMILIPVYESILMLRWKKTISKFKNVLKIINQELDLEELNNLLSNNDLTPNTESVDIFETHPNEDDNPIQ